MAASSGPAEPAPPVLTDADAAALLALARAAVESTVRHHALPGPTSDQLSPALVGPAAAFVTLHEHGELRGCMGRLDPGTPLWENVVLAGAMAAASDPRFEPVAEAELADIRLEVSVLGATVELPGPAAFDARRQGIIVERGGRRALFLPQVAAELGWDEATTLDAVCQKAGLPKDAWRRAGTRLYAFLATPVAEPGFHD
jgi:AmmeMemoRadiSam system protein A